MLRARYSPRGVQTLGFEDERDRERRRRPTPHADDGSGTKSRSKKKRSDAPELGDALRSVYDTTLREDIPAEMLDLLGKLG